MTYGCQKFTRTGIPQHPIQTRLLLLHPYPNVHSLNLQDLLAGGEQNVDLSGNPVLEDIGIWLHDQLVSNFLDADVKYIAPSYMIRSTTTTATDRVYCKVSPSTLIIPFAVIAERFPHINEN